MSVRGFRDSFRDFTVNWLQNRPGKNVGYRWLWAMIMPLDIIAQAVICVVRAAFPGGNGTPTALPMIGRSRGLSQGPNETDTNFVTRLQAWLDDWRECGSDEMLAKQLQLVVGNTPMVRIIQRSGHVTTRAVDGTVSYAQCAWNWDGSSNPERANYWSDLWIVIYTPPWTITGTSLASLVGLWGTGSGLGIGHGCPRVAVDAILSLVATWKGAHTRVRAIIWSYDATLFDPATPSSLPDGWWGKWGKQDPAHPTQTIPSRSQSARYWVPRDPFPADSY